MICVEAPAGYGKTVATTLWLKHAERNAVMTRVSPYDNTQGIFFRRLLATIGSAYQNSEVLEAAAASPDFERSPCETTVSAFLSLPRAPAFGVDTLVIDDCHLIRNAEIIRSIPYVVDALPSAISVLLLGRTEAKIFSFLRTEGIPFARIGMNVLKFSSEDVALCLEIYGRYVSEREAARLCEATDGWPAPLALAAGTGKVSRAVEEYIKRTVWDKLRDDVKDFLTRVCVGGEMHPEICSLLTEYGPEESRAMLELAREGSGGLLRRADAEDGDQYVCCKAFLEFLRTRNEAREEAGKLCAIALDYYMKMENWYNAAICAVRSGAAESLSRAVRHILRRCVTDSVSSKNIQNMKILHGAIPEAKFAQFPYLYILSARYLNLIGDSAGMCCALDRLDEAMLKIAEKFPEFYGGAIIAGALDHRHPNGVSWLRHRVASKSRELPELMPPVSKSLPFFHKGEKDLSGFLRLFGNASKLKKISSIWGDARETVESVLQAGLCYERNRLKEAAGWAAAARESLADPRFFPPGKPPSPETIFYVYMIGTAILDAQERGDEASRLREELRAGLEANEEDALLTNLAAYEAKQRIMHGDAGMAEIWLDNHFDDVGCVRLELYRIFQCLSTARALMTLREPEESRDFLCRLIRLADDFGRVTDKAEAMTLLAVLEWHRGSEDEAVAVLGGAIASVQEYRYVRVFAEEGASILPVLFRLKEVERKRSARLNTAFLNEILAAAGERAKRRAGIASAFPTPLPKLTKQQILVLEYLANGCKRFDIAHRTNLSPDTIKFHIAKLYSKLNVHNATDAVRKSREMGLI
jgi:LuxR family maltose regulon positive regulatory protein